MKNKVKRTLSFLLTFVMLCSLLPAMAMAKEPSERYEEVEGTGAITENAKVEVYTTKGGGHVERTGDNLVDTTFPQMTGYREYTATPNTDWVFDTWRYEQWVGRDENNRKDVGNDTEAVTGRYSFSNTGDDWYTKYETGNRTISVNRLSLHGDLLNPIVYKVYADFNPTIKATAGDYGTISGSEEPVVVEYGTSQAFDITADKGYVIDTITVDGQKVAAGQNEEFYTYTFENVTKPHTIDVTFKVKPESDEFTVTYVVKGDVPKGYEPPEIATVNEGEIYTVEPVPGAVADYKFEGWYNEDQEIVTKFEVKSDVILTGIWTYTGEKDVWDTVYGTIRVYMDEGTEADFDALDGNFAKQVRIYSDKYLTDGYRLCGYEPMNDFWYTTNAKDVTARDISEIVLAKDKLIGSSEKISIPMTGNDKYTVTVTEETDYFGWIPYTYLKIEISKKEPVEETVQLTYDMNGGVEDNQVVQANKNEVYTLDSTIKPTHDAVQGMEVTFQGWSTDSDVIDRIYSSDQIPAVQSTVPVQDKDVTVYAVWAFDASQVPDVHPVQVVVYQNGNTETPVKTEIIDYVREGDKFDIDSLNINDYYSSDYGFETTGWYDDGKWNEYKAGNNPDALKGEITINGWTNVICMVTDWEPVHVFAVTDGDKENKEEIYSNKALKGTDLIAFLDQNVTVLEKEGYTVDKWYNWDWYGNKYASDTKVNGWTNAYVTYTSIDTNRTVEVTFNIAAADQDKGYFTEYEAGPVEFKNLPADSTEQYLVPQVTAKPGYKFVGWKGQGADVIEWDANASTFGVPGLCYFPEGSDVGYATITAVFEEVSTEDKIANVYFTVNPQYGYFKEYGEGPVSFENIDADSTQQFEVPEVVAKSGYKFVGWEGKGAGEIKWDANASTFGVPGLCYFPEGSNVGRADIRAVFEKEGGGHINDYAVTVIVDGKGEVKTKDYGTVGSNDTDVIWIPDFVDSVKFTMEPADGWKIDDVLVNGKSIGAEDSYVFETEDLMDGPELKVIFEKKSSGGGGGGSHDKDDDKDKDKAPDKTPDALNGEDHFNYIVGDADGKVHPERNITRAEVASIFFRLLKDDVRSENLTDQNTFTDVSADDWYNVAVSTMSDMGIVFGRTDYQFDPEAYITRAEFAAIAARFDSESYSGDDLFTDIEGHWAENQINRAAEKGWITGYPDGTFDPNRYITRAEAVTMINRVLNRMPEDEDALHEDMKVFVDNADANAWYYLAIQEATNSHEYEKDDDGVYETWTDVLPDRDWAQYLKLN